MNPGIDAMSRWSIALAFAGWIAGCSSSVLMTSDGGIDGSPSDVPPAPQDTSVLDAPTRGDVVADVASDMPAVTDSGADAGQMDSRVGDAGADIVTGSGPSCTPDGLGASPYDFTALDQWCTAVWMAIGFAAAPADPTAHCYVPGLLSSPSEPAYTAMQVTCRACILAELPDGGLWHPCTCFTATASDRVGCGSR